MITNCMCFQNVISFWFWCYIVMFNVIFWRRPHKCVTIIICKHTTTTEDIITTVYVIENQTYKTENSNFVYWFLWTCLQTNYFVKSYESGRKTNLHWFQHRLTSNEIQKSCDRCTILYNIGYWWFFNSKHISFPYILTSRPTHTHSHLHS